jgi:chromosome partitioning protein
MLGEEDFVKHLPTQNIPYGTTIRSFLQRFLQNTGGEEVFLQKGKHTSQNVDLIAGDFWLNIYADSLNVGNDLLMGSGLSRYVSLTNIVKSAEERLGASYDYVIVDLPPSFGALIRAAFYASDYYIVPCASDNFSVYCVGLIGQMVPGFVSDWTIGLQRFKTTNPHFTNFDDLGKPVFAGWIFNGFDTARKRRSTAEIANRAALGPKKMIRADETMHSRIVAAISEDLVAPLRRTITSYAPVAENLPTNFRIGDIEDANVLIQNSIWLSVPLSDLDQHDQLVTMRDRSKWAEDQLEQISLFARKFGEAADHIIGICV